MAPMVLWMVLALTLSVVEAAPTATILEEAHPMSWSYDPEAMDGPATWGNKFPQCAQLRQSPVDIDYLSAQYGFTPPLHFDNLNEKPLSQTIRNDGHTVRVTLETKRRPIMYDGGLPGGGVFNFAHYHFHWGSDDSRGSEHTLDTVRFPMELHLVFYNSCYKSAHSLHKAVRNRDGLAVVSVLFQVSETDNAALSPIVKSLKDLQTSGSEIVLAFEDTRSLAAMLPHDSGSFYRYDGSLTSPTCNEVVTWTILNNVMPVSQAQLAAFRALENDKGVKMQNNFRPTQPLHNRIVYRSFQ